ncbi:MFS general substrate transporter [Mycena crocata]|nr:MFS general substrate transporter [Mycena crocata]
MATERSPLIFPTEDDEEEEELSRVDFALLTTGLWIIGFISSLDTTIVATLTGSIGSSLGSMQLSSWIGTSYLLSLCATTSLYVHLANLVGRRPSILLAGILFWVGTIQCGFAENIYQLIAFRALAGLGGGGMGVVGAIIVSDWVPPESRGLYMGCATLVYALGGVMGAPLGGWLGDTIGWRAAFLCQSPLLLFALILIFLKAREPRSILDSPPDSIYGKLKCIDYAGPPILVLALLSFLVGMSFRSIGAHEWTNPRVWGFLITGLVFACFFIWVERNFAVEPGMPINILKRRTPALLALSTFLLSMVNLSTVYNAPLYFTAARLRTSANAGAHLLPYSLCVGIGGLFPGWWYAGRFRKIQIFASLCLLITALALASWDSDTPEWVLYTTLMPLGFGLDIIGTTMVLAVMGSVPNDEISLVTGISFLFRRMGEVLGVSLSAILTQRLLARNLRERIVGPGAEDTIADILASTWYIHTLSVELQEKATESWMSALHAVFCCHIILMVVAILSVLLLQEHSPNHAVQRVSYHRDAPFVEAERSRQE